MYYEWLEFEVFEDNVGDIVVDEQIYQFWEVFTILDKE